MGLERRRQGLDLEALGIMSLPSLANSLMRVPRLMKTGLGVWESRGRAVWEWAALPHSPHPAPVSFCMEPLAVN